MPTTKVHIGHQIAGAQACRSTHALSSLSTHVLCGPLTAHTASAADKHIRASGECLCARGCCSKQACGQTTQSILGYARGVKQAPWQPLAQRHCCRESSGPHAGQLAKSKQATPCAPHAPGARLSKAEVREQPCLLMKGTPKVSCPKRADKRIRPGVVQLGWIRSNIRRPTQAGRPAWHSGPVGQIPKIRYSTATTCAKPRPLAVVLQALPMKLDCVGSVAGRPKYAWKTEVSDLSHVSAMTSNVSGSAVADTAASNTLRSASACAPHALASS